MGMELGCGVAIDGTGGVVLELRGDELARRLCRIIAADAGLGVAIQLCQRGGYGSPVRVSYALVATNESGEGDGLWSGKGSVPPGAMLDGLDCLPFGALVLVTLSMLDELVAAKRMLPL